MIATVTNLPFQNIPDSLVSRSAMATYNALAVPQKKKRYSEKQWNEVRPEACRLYLHGDKIDEDTRLQAVMGEIERKYGLQACPKTWKSKLKDWGCTKNVPTKTMKWIIAREMSLNQKGESTKFTYKNKPIMPRTIRAFKRRRDEVEDEPVLLDMGTPPDIEYSSQSLITESHSSSQVVELSTNSEDDHTSIRLSDATENSQSYKINLPSYPVTKDVDGWLSDDQGQFYRYHLFEDVSCREDAIINHHKVLFFDISELENSLVQFFPPDDHIKPRLSVRQRLRHSFDLCGIGGHLCIDLQPSVNISQGNSTLEEDALDHLLSCAVTLADYQCRYRDLPPPTMEKHFAVAKAFENIEHYLTAEYHCRKIVEQYCKIKAEMFPYTFSPNGCRQEESTVFLLRALTVFIIEFNSNSLDKNTWLFQHMELLYTVLIRLQGERFDSGLSLRMYQLRATLALPDSDDEVSTIYPQLFVHGFHLAHESSLLGFIQTAAWMYDYLLRCCSEHLDVLHHAIEKATAHARYSVLLRRQGEWRSSAHQLLLACEMITDSVSYDHPLRDELENDYRDLQPYLEQTLAKKLKKSFDNIRIQISLSVDNVSGAIGVLSINKSLDDESPFTPESPANHETLAFDQLESFISGEPAIEEVPSDKESTVVTSTLSTHESGSNGMGVSWSRSGGEDLGIYDWDQYATS